VRLGRVGNREKVKQKGSRLRHGHERGGLQNQEDKAKKAGDTKLESSKRKTPWEFRNRRKLIES